MYEACSTAPMVSSLTVDLECPPGRPMVETPPVGRGAASPPAEAPKGVPAPGQNVKAGVEGEPDNLLIQ